MNSSLRKNYILNISLVFVLFLVLVSPFFAHAQLKGITYVCPDRPNASGVVVPGECNFDDLVLAVNALVNWGTIFALSFSVFVLAWAGFLYMTSGGNPGQITKATGLLTKVVIGIALILAAYLIVKLIITSLGINVSFF